jgi:hypothetical protein
MQHADTLQHPTSKYSVERDQYGSSRHDSAHAGTPFHSAQDPVQYVFSERHEKKTSQKRAASMSHASTRKVEPMRLASVLARA